MRPQDGARTPGRRPRPNYGHPQGSANSYDIADVAAATAGTVAVVFGWNRADTEAFAAIAASCGVSAAAAAEPAGDDGGDRRVGEVVPQGPLRFWEHEDPEAVADQVQEA